MSCRLRTALPQHSQGYPPMNTRQDWLQQHAITHIECLFPDLNGQARGKLVPVSHYPANGELRFPQVSLIQSWMGEPQQQLVPDTDPDLVLLPDPEARS